MDDCWPVSHLSSLGQAGLSGPSVAGSSLYTTPCEALPAPGRAPTFPSLWGKSMFWDEFIAKFHTVFADKGHDCEEALASLQLLTECHSPDTVSLEWGHGRTSRILESHAVQSHRPSMEWLNSQVVCLQHQRRLGQAGAASLAPRRKRTRAEARGSSAVRGVTKKRKGGGGAWRAFASMKTKFTSGRPDWVGVAKEYRIAKRERWFACFWSQC